MTQVKIEDLRNVVFCGHGSAGKTSLVDSLLMTTGAVSGEHSVDDGTSICDFEPEEKEHHYTIETSVVHCDHAGKHFNLIDTPGYPDFIGEVIGALRAVEIAAVCVNAHAGIQLNTHRVFEEAEVAGIGRVVVLTKLDDEQADFNALLESMRDLWGSRVVPLNIPLGQGGDIRGVASTLDPPGDASDAVMNVGLGHEMLVEAIVEADEELMERYFDGQMPSPEELITTLPMAVAQGHVIPVFCTATKKRIGLTELLDLLAMVGPNPDEIDREVDNDGEMVRLRADADGPLVGQVFKTRIDPFVQKLSYMRIYSGQLSKDQTIHASGARKDIKLGQIMDPQGADNTPIDQCSAGQIVAVTKIEDLHTGTSVGEIELPAIPFPRPMVGLAVQPKSRGDENKLSASLGKIVEEDPTFHLDRDPQTSELVMTGMSELHLQVIQQRLSRRDKVELETHDPKIPFREAIQAEASGSYRHKKQSGGRGQFGEVHIRIYPLPRGTNIDEYVNKVRFPQLKNHSYHPENNFLFVDSVVGGVIPSNFMPAVEAGFVDRMNRGVLAGYQAQDVCVEVHYGKHHPVDSSEAAFKMAASMGLRNVFREANPCLLEPVVKMDITVPEDFVGDIYSDMSSRGGRVLGSDAMSGDLQTIHCEVALRAVGHYNRKLSSVTGGQGSYLMDFSHYEPMPMTVQQEIIAGSKVQEEEAS